MSWWRWFLFPTFTPMKFSIKTSDTQTQARTGTITLSRGIIETPIFMPVGTAATVKAVHFNELHQLQAEIILGNTYHLYLRPGLEILKTAGGLHGFNGWQKPILTDSGGYQVYSLGERRKITEEGVKFQSHIDGSYHHFTPEGVIDIQRTIGGDIIMAFDECTPYPCEYTYAKKSMEMTHRWLDRCFSRFNETKAPYKHDQVLFPIVQGSVFPDLRKQSAEVITSKNALGNAIGGLSVGEPAEDMYEMTGLVCSILPKDKPRYLMGVGKPENILESIALGIDMFDCVLPTRNARNGTYYTKKGVVNIKNKKWENDHSPIDPDSPMEVCRTHTKAFLRHLIISKEILGKQLASIQNLSFYLWLVREARKQINAGTFSAWKNMMVQQVVNRL